MPFPVRVGIARKSGVPIDLFERTLRDEGWLDKDEKLLDILRDPNVLKRGKIIKDIFDTEEETDYQANERYKKELKEDYEPEEPPPGNYVTVSASELS